MESLERLRFLAMISIGVFVLNSFFRRCVSAPLHLPFLDSARADTTRTALDMACIRRGVVPLFGILALLGIIEF